MSQFLFAVDTQFQLWLDEYMSPPCCNQVDNSLLNFTPLIKSIRFGTFVVTLPITFFAMAEKETLTGGKTTPNKQSADKKEEDNTQKKKKGQIQGREGERVKMTPLLNHANYYLPKLGPPILPTNALRIE